MRRRPKPPSETTALPEQGGQGVADAPTVSFGSPKFDLDAGVGNGPLGVQQPSAMPTQGAGGAFGSAANAQQRDPVPAAPVAAEPEYTVVRVRRHGRHLVLPVLVLIAVAGLSGYYVGTFPELWMNLAAGAGAVALALLAGIGPIFSWLARRTVITTRRAIVHRGFFVRHRSEVSLMRVREVRSRQNLVQRIWGSGDVDLIVGAEATRLHDVPRVKDLHAALRELSEHNYDEQQRQAGFVF